MSPKKMTGEKKSNLNIEPQSQDSSHEAEKQEPAEELLPQTTIVTHCIYKNNPYRLARCFEDDSDPFKESVQELINQRDDSGKSPLDIAASLGRIELTRKLIECGADVTSTTQKDYTCLHHAAAWGRLPVLKILVDSGGDLQKMNVHGERPRDTAQRYTQAACVEYLDWAEAKFKLREEIRITLEALQDVDKAVAGRITKEEKTLTINTCKEKQEWLDNATDPTTQDFISHFTNLTDIVAPILQKLSEPAPVKDSTGRPRSKTRPASGARPRSGARSGSGKRSAGAGAMFNPQKGKKKGK